MSHPLSCWPSWPATCTPRASAGSRRWPRGSRGGHDVIEAVEFVGVTLMEGDEDRSTVRSDDVAEQFDRLQQEAGEGPGLDAVRVGRVVHAPD